MGKEDKKMKNETRNDEAVSPVIATILMVAITVVLAGVLYVWAANLAESNTDGNLDLYVFSGNDAPDRTLADGSTDKGAVIVTMTQGSDLGWASITIKASVDGAASVTVPMCDATTEENCWESADSDQTNWNVGEAVTVDTSCDGTCVVEVTILNSRDGVTLDTSTIDSE